MPLSPQNVSGAFIADVNAERQSAVADDGDPEAFRKLRDELDLRASQCEDIGLLVAERDFRWRELQSVPREAWPDFYREYAELMEQYELRVRQVLRGESRQQREATFGRPFTLIECGVLPVSHPPE